MCELMHVLILSSFRLSLFTQGFAERKIEDALLISLLLATSLAAH